MPRQELLPAIDEANLAEEVKRFINEKKMDLVDWGLMKIECYPPPDSDDYPETRKLSTQWAAAFNHAEKVIDTEGFPEDLMQEFEKACARIMALINSDTEYWEKIREVVIPLYDRSKDYEKWKKRWKSVHKFWYYPESLTVTTKRGTVRKKKAGLGQDGKPIWEVVERIMEDDPFRTTTYPAGLVVNIL